MNIYQHLFILYLLTLFDSRKTIRHNVFTGPDILEAFVSRNGLFLSRIFQPNNLAALRKRERACSHGYVEGKSKNEIERTRQREKEKGKEQQKENLLSQLWRYTKREIQLISEYSFTLNYVATSAERYVFATYAWL